VVTSPKGFGYKEVSLNISMTCKSQQGISNMKVHVKDYDKVYITKKEGLEK
jgi:hypothetical protein